MNLQFIAFFFILEKVEEVMGMHLPDFKVARTNTKIAYETKQFHLDERYRNQYKGKTCYLRTYGCQMNEHDSENIKGILEEMGFSMIDDYEQADLIILNTCSIRENAHNKAFGFLGRVKHLKEIKPEIMVGLCGCMAQEEVVAKKILEDYPWLNFVIGTHNFYELPYVLDQSLQEHKLQIEVYSREKDLVEGMPIERDNPYKAYINIIYGCDKFCTYCIVPYTRGRQRSRAKEDIIAEVKSLVEAGYQEVTLLGQNVNAYGKDLYTDYSLAELLADVAKTNIPRIRFMTSHPWDFTDEMIEVIASYPNIMPSIHLPVQSGSSRVLKRMGRSYSREEYLTLFHKMKEKIARCTISTDIIVGFPGESEEDFQETLSLVKTCKFDNAFTFIYSPRVGTPAAKLTDNLTKEEKEKRLHILNQLVNQYFLENNQKLVNTVLPVLIEGKFPKKEDSYFGYTDTNKLVNVSGNVKEGSIVPVLITDAKTWSLDGKVYNG